MKIVVPFLIAIALSMDVLAVSTAYGINHKKTHIKHIFLVAILFAFAHIIMFLGGYLLIGPLASWVTTIGHFIAFALLAGIGGKMIFFSAKEGSCFTTSLTCTKTVSTLAIATSLDAFGVGVSFALVSKPIILLLIATFFCVFATALLGFKAGNMLGRTIGKKSEFVGGIILVLISIKILVEYYL